MRALVIALLLVAGCYDPHPPTGAYLCGTPATDGGVGSCPQNLECHCGLCVKNKTDSACSFTISGGSTTPTVKEHERFPVTVSALDEDGHAATGFSGTVTLSSNWGDVCVGTSGCVRTATDSKNTVELVNGVAMTPIQLNRETSPPQVATLSASYGAYKSQADTLKITVVSTPAVPDKMPLVAPLTGGKTSTYGFAETWIGSPSVMKTSTGWTMYFIAGNGALAGEGAGVATSTDGLTFVPQPNALFTSTDSTGAFGAVDAYTHTGGTSLFYGQGSASFSTGPVGYNKVVRAEAPSSGGPFGSPATTISASSCAACSNLDFPYVVPDPNPALSGGEADSAVMFFTALQTVTNGTGLSILRATATDGTHFIVDPGEALTTTSDERAIVAPRVLLDGTVIKMWYSFGPSGLDPCSGSAYKIGYATSADGYYWVRSPQNQSATPALLITTVPWVTAAKASALVGSVLPADGVDPSNGVALYFSPVSTQGLSCLPNGIGRAVLNGPS